jgi:hypothetical protein
MALRFFEFQVSEKHIVENKVACWLFDNMSFGKMSIPLSSEICLSVTWYSATWNSEKRSTN